MCIFYPKAAKLYFHAVVKAIGFFVKNCTLLMVGENILMKRNASSITAKSTLKKFFMVKNPFLFLVGGAEKGFKALLPSAALVDEKK